MSDAAVVVATQSERLKLSDLIAVQNMAEIRMLSTILRPRVSASAKVQEQNARFVKCLMCCI